MIKKTGLIILILVFPAFASAEGTILNYPHLYRGMRSLAMGGAFTAVGGDYEAVFYNPAGLQDMGFKLNLVNPLLEVNKNAVDIGSDLQDALDLASEEERTDALIDILADNIGELLHVRAALFPSVSISSLTVGFLGQAGLDARLHEPFGSAGAIEVRGGYDYGPIAGFSFPVPVTGLRLGASAKYMNRRSVDESFTVAELVSDSFDIEDYETTNSDYSFDIGLLYELPFLPGIKPKVGLSVLDITDLDFEEGGIIPQRVNIGAAITATVPVISELIIAADYEDVSNEFEQDKSVGKRLHVGAEAGFLDRHLLIRAGLNQGYPSFGAEVDIWLLKLGYTFYSEEAGAYAGQDRDSRHLIQANLGW